MSITEVLHKKIDEMSESQQQKLLETVQQILSEPDDSDEDQAQNEELIRRYNHLRAHPDQVVSARESNRQIRQQYSQL